MRVAPRSSSVAVVRTGHAVTIGGIALRTRAATSLALRTGSAAIDVTCDASEYDVLAEIDFAGMWFANEATDDGTTLTIPNVVSGGPAMTSTGAGRPTISATAARGQPGIVNTGATQKLSAAIDLTGETGCTIWLLLYEPNNTPGASIPFRYGVGAADSLYSYSNIFGTQSQDFSRATAIGTPIARTSGINSGLVYPRVLCYRTDSALASGEMLPVQTDGVDGVTTYAGPTNTTGTLAGGPFDWLSDNGGSFFPGIGVVAAVARGSVSSARVAAVSSYLHSRANIPTGFESCWIGDSITSAGGGGLATWRSEVQSLATAAGAYWYHACGPINGGVFANDRYLANGGNTIANIVTALTTYGVGTLVRPDVIGLLIGTNDVGAGTPNATIAVALGTLLDDLAARLPATTIYLQKLLPRTDTAPKGLQVADWNANYYDAVVSAAQARGVRVVADSTFLDLYTAGAIVFLDGLHPNEASGPAMGAAQWANVQAWRS